MDDELRRVAAAIDREHDAAIEQGGLQCDGREAAFAGLGDGGVGEGGAATHPHGVGGPGVECGLQRGGVDDGDDGGLQRAPWTTTPLSAPRPCSASAAARAAATVPSCTTRTSRLSIEGGVGGSRQVDEGARRGLELAGGTFLGLPRASDLADGLAHAGEGVGDLAHALELLGGEDGDLLEAIGRPARVGEDRLERGGGVAGAARAVDDDVTAARHGGDSRIGLVGDLPDDAADGGDGAAGPVREFLDRVGDDAKATPVLAGLRGDDGGVEREQRGLLGDVRNRPAEDVVKAQTT